MAFVLLHACWVAGRLILGRWPRAYIDDPSGVLTGAWAILDVVAGIFVVYGGLG